MDLLKDILIHKSPRNTFAAAPHLLKKPFSLTLFSVVDHAFLLLVWKLVEVFGPFHILESAHCISSRSVRSVLSEGVNVDLETFLFVCLVLYVRFITDGQAVWVRIQ